MRRGRISLCGSLLMLSIVAFVSTLIDFSILKEPLRVRKSALMEHRNAFFCTCMQLGPGIRYAWITVLKNAIGSLNP